MFARGPLKEEVGEGEMIEFVQFCLQLGLEIAGQQNIPYFRFKQNYNQLSNHVLIYSFLSSS